MNKYTVVKKGQQPTQKQLEELQKLRDIEPIPDDNNPELTFSDMERFRIAAIKKREERQKQVLTLRVSPETMKKAKSLGKGYTGILSRLLEMALNDPNMIEKCL